MRRFSIKSIFKKEIGAIPPGTAKAVPSLTDSKKVGMRRSFYLLGSALLLLPLLWFFPAGCSKKYSVSPVSTSSKPATNYGNVTTLAGSGTQGSINGQGTAAEFYWPNGIAVDSSGNLFIADSGNGLIRKITPGGLVSTLAGSGTAGFANGQGTAASFNFPTGIALDPQGNIYAADMANNQIRKITSGNVVTTLAGSTTSGSTDGTGTAASFNSPAGVAVDASGNVYVADMGNNMIRKITSGGVVSTLAGQAGMTGSTNGQGTAALFNQPYGIAVDSSGNVYAGDYHNNLIRKITSGGLVSTLAGSGTAGYVDGQGAAAEFDGPCGVAVNSSGTIYAADSINNMIREITPGGLVSTLAGGGPCCAVNGTGTNASFSSPGGVAVDLQGTVYVADTGDNMIRKIQ